MTLPLCQLFIYNSFFIIFCEQIVVRFDGNNGPGVEETSLNTGTKTHVQKILNGLKGNISNLNLCLDSKNSTKKSHFILRNFLYVNF